MHGSGISTVMNMWRACHAPAMQAFYDPIKNYDWSLAHTCFSVPDHWIMLKRQLIFYCLQKWRES
jgi:hypothetical protein